MSGIARRQISSASFIACARELSRSGSQALPANFGMRQSTFEYFRRPFTKTYPRADPLLECALKCNAEALFIRTRSLTPQHQLIQEVSRHLNEVERMFRTFEHFSYLRDLSILQGWHVET
jgi:hypothetical protein